MRGIAVSDVRSAARHFGVLTEWLERSGRDQYLGAGWAAAWAERTRQDLRIGWFARLWERFVDRERARSRSLLHLAWQTDSPVRRCLNDDLRRRLMVTHKVYFDTVESNPLTERQRWACVTDEDATLVIAGAGTGKTSTILAKIGLLIRCGQCRPEEILAISFTRKSAKELEERIEKKLGAAVRISTFHSLGLAIIAEAEGRKPSVTASAADPQEKRRRMDGMIATLCQSDERFAADYLQFMNYYRVEMKAAWEFSSLAEYSESLRANGVRSLDGKMKNSLEECVIANWLIQNGVPFQYERPYEHDTRTVDHRQYQPDFYIPSIGLYIEHFGIDRQGRTAPYIDHAQYHEQMKWKRETHRAHGTQMLETYSWEFADGILLRKLEKALIEASVVLKPLSVEQLLKRMNDSGVVSTLASLMTTFLTLYKGNGSRVRPHEGRRSKWQQERQALFLRLFERLHDVYENENAAAGEIDFEDMIERATAHVRAGRVHTTLRYILVDEFQDISPGRAALIASLRERQTDCRLFVVGDDWQSIYRFAGSDLGAMMRFSEAFGPAERVSLDTTFRFHSALAEVSDRFVQKNPAQIRKSLQAVRQSDRAGVVVCHRAPAAPVFDDALTQIAAEAPAGPSVLILARYNFQLPDAAELRRLKGDFPTLRFTALSAHASKGLESDYVLLLIGSGEWGFPAQMVDDPLLQLVLTAEDEYPHGEERRLFYVAMTRARQRTFLLVEPSVEPSAFVSELLADRGYRVERQGEGTRPPSCPQCGSGSLHLRPGVGGTLYRCSNQPLCRYSEGPCPACGTGRMMRNPQSGFQCRVCAHALPACPRCATGRLERRQGAHGEFLGCSNYADGSIRCRYTQSVA